jgi:hypothetical protein
LTIFHQDRLITAYLLELSVQVLLSSVSSAELLLEALALLLCFLGLQFLLLQVHLTLLSISIYLSIFSIAEALQFLFEPGLFLICLGLRLDLEVFVFLTKRP